MDTQRVTDHYRKVLAGSPIERIVWLNEIKKTEPELYNELCIMDCLHHVAALMNIPNFPVDYEENLNFICSDSKGKEISAFLQLGEQRGLNVEQVVLQQIQLMVEKEGRQQSFGRGNGGLKILMDYLIKDAAKIYIPQLIAPLKALLKKYAAELKNTQQGAAYHIHPEMVATIIDEWLTAIKAIPLPEKIANAFKAMHNQNNPHFMLITFYNRILGSALYTAVIEEKITKGAVFLGETLKTMFNLPTEKTSMIPLVMTMHMVKFSHNHRITADFFADFFKKILGEVEQKDITYMQEKFSHFMQVVETRAPQKVLSEDEIEYVKADHYYEEYVQDQSYPVFIAPFLKDKFEPTVQDQPAVQQQDTAPKHQSTPADCHVLSSALKDMHDHSGIFTPPAAQAAPPLPSKPAPLLADMEPLIKDLQQIAYASLNRRSFGRRSPETAQFYETVSKLQVGGLVDFIAALTDFSVWQARLGASLIGQSGTEIKVKDRFGEDVIYRVPAGVAKMWEKVQQYHAQHVGKAMVDQTEDAANPSM